MLAVELCGASIHPGAPLLELPYVADTSDQYGGLVPRSRHSDLRQAYLQNSLDHDPDFCARLAHEIRQEDRVQSEFQRFLGKDVNGRIWATSYAEPLAFAGGGAQLLRQLETSSSLVEQAVARIPVDAPRFYCGLNPGLGLGATSFAVENGIVVLIDSGFLAALRILVQTIAASLDTIRAVPERWIDGDLLVDGQYGSLHDLLERCDAGQDVRDHPIQISLHTGSPDHLRRHAMLTAITQLIAHEVGHWSRSRPGPDGTWVADNLDYQRDARVTSIKQLAQPIDEIDEVATSNAEHHADSIACSVQLQTPLWSGRPMLGQIIGAMSPLALHAGLWWRRAAYTDRNLGWTHPYPELRMGLVGMLVGRRDESGRVRAQQRSSESNATNVDTTPTADSIEDTSHRFDHWVRGMLDIEKNRSVALERGLDERGLGVMNRFSIELERRLRNSSD